MINYALQVTGGVHALAVTHLDWLADLKEWTYCCAYEGINEESATRNLVEQFMNGDRITQLSLKERGNFTLALKKARPVYESCEPDSKTVLNKIVTLTRHKVAFASFGTTALTLQNLGKFYKKPFIIMMIHVDWESKA
jgi:adenylosuccinate synthase